MRLVSTLRYVLGATSDPSSEGHEGYDSTRKAMAFHDGVRKRMSSTMGFMPYAYPIGGSPTQVTTTALALAAAQGAVAIPIALEGHMLLDSVSFWNTDAATARGGVEYGLYEDRLDNANALNVVDSGTLASFTPTVASLRTITSPTSPAPYLPPGLYWLVIKNNHASNTLGIGVTAAGTMATNAAQTKTLTGVFSFGSTLDLVAATWTKIATVPGVRLNGRVFGQAAAF